MTKEDVIKTFRIVAKANGFEIRETPYTPIGLDIVSENLNFFITDSVDWHKAIEEKVIHHVFFFKASVSRMGGETSADELFEIADEIKRGAVVVETLNMWGLNFDEELKTE